MKYFSTQWDIYVHDENYFFTLSYSIFSTGMIVFYTMNYHYYFCFSTQWKILFTYMYKGYFSWYKNFSTNILSSTRQLCSKYFRKIVMWVPPPPNTNKKGGSSWHGEITQHLPPPTFLVPPPGRGLPPSSKKHCKYTIDCIISIVQHSSRFVQSSALTWSNVTK